MIPLADGADNFTNLVQLLVRTITAVTQQAVEGQDLLHEAWRPEFRR